MIELIDNYDKELMITAALPGSGEWGCGGCIWAEGMFAGSVAARFGPEAIHPALRRAG